MPTIAEAAGQLAAALSAVDGVQVGTDPIPAPPPGAGWVVMRSLTPAVDSFSGLDAELAALVVLTSDEQLATAQLLTLGPQLLRAALVMPGAGHQVQPELLLVAGSAPLFCAVVSLTVEVS